MPICFLFDEHLRGVTFRMVQRYNARGMFAIDVVCVGNGHVAPPPLGTRDPELLMWAEEADRILVSRDQKTMPAHFAQHLATGRHSPRLFIVKDVRFRQVVEFLAAVTHASEPEEWRDRVEFIP